MKPIEIYQQTEQRLRDYQLFSEATIKTVAEFAQKQAGYATYQDFFKATGVPEVKLHTFTKSSAVPVVDIPAMSKERGVLVMHMPMGNSVDPSQLYQVATVAAVNPSHRVIAFGNPSGKPFSFREQNLTFKDRFNIAFTKNLKSLVAPELDYLQSKGITAAFHIGYSYGALKALIASDYSQPGQIKGLLLIDPVAHPRYPQQLLGDFSSTFKPMGEYVNRTHMQTYLDARQDAMKLVDYSKGLARRINVAIGLLLSRMDFIKKLDDVMKKYPKADVTVAWGGKSELGNDAHLKANLYNLSQEYPYIHTMRLENDTHAFANDIHLYAAIVNTILTQ